MQQIDRRNMQMTKSQAERNEMNNDDDNQRKQQSTINNQQSTINNQQHPLKHDEMDRIIHH
jgi:hypothetical protein